VRFFRHAFIGLLAAAIVPVGLGEPAVPRTRAAELTNGAYREIPFSAVRIDDSFWTPRIETIQQVTIPDLMEILEDQGKLDNLRIIAGRKNEGRIRAYNSPDYDI
jgi:hypothetical protein